MSKNYMYSLGGSGGGNATASIQKNMAKDNLIQHSEIMDFPELLERLTNYNIGYVTKNSDHFPSQKTLTFTLTNGANVDCTIDLFPYVLNQAIRSNEVRYYTFTFYVTYDDFSTLVDASISGGGKVIDSRKEVVEGYYNLYKYTFLLEIPSNNSLEALRLILNARSLNQWVTGEVSLSSLKMEYGDIATIWVPTKESGGLIKNIAKTGEKALYLESTGATLSDLVIITAYPDYPELSKIELLHVGEDIGMLIPLSMGEMAISGMYAVVSRGSSMIVAINEDNLTDEQKTLESSVMIIGNGYTYSIE